MRHLLVPLILLVGCGPKDDDTGSGAISFDDSAYYDPNVLLEVAITLPESDFDALRQQTRDIMDIIGGADCLDEPFAKPYTWFSADITVDGETVTNVGVRKKGFIGSLSEDKPGLKIKFDQYVPDQNLAGMERMTFNNNVQDPALIRQCLGYQVLGDLGIPAPRCNFARVTVNGEYMGIYSHVEPIKKDFLAREFGHRDGDLYEGTLSDFREGWEGTFEVKTDSTDPSKAAITALSEALTASNPDLIPTLDPLLDIDAYLTFWAGEVLIGHWDGYAGNTNNFYVYAVPSDGRIRFIPWGIDGIMRDLPPFGEGPSSVVAWGELARRLYGQKDGADGYEAALLAALDVWDEEALLAEIDRMTALVNPHAGELDYVLYEQDMVREFIQGRRETIVSELGTPEAEWPYDSRGGVCLVDHGPVTIDIDTTWGTLETDPFTTGSGSIEFVWDGVPYGPWEGGGIAGVIEEEYEPFAVIAATTLIPGTTELYQGVVAFPMDWLEPGTHLLSLFGESEVYSALQYMDFASMEEPVPIAYITEGSLTFEEASPVEGAPLVATVQGRLYGGE